MSNKLPSQNTIAVEIYVNVRATGALRASFRLIKRGMGWNLK